MTGRSSNEDIGSGPRPPLSVDRAQRLVAEAEANTVVLAEGWSDQAAIETLARRVGLNFAAMGIVVLAIGGATNARDFAVRFGIHGLRLRLAGLYDLQEEQHFLRAISAGVSPAMCEFDAGRLGFYACNEDLEDELIRALGSEIVVQTIAAEGEIGAFRRFQMQPAQRGRSLVAHLRRFLGTKARRKIRYGTLLADAVDLRNIPPPLSHLLLHLGSGDRSCI